MLATSASAAADVLMHTRDVIASVEELGGLDLGRGLLIAVSYDDEPLLRCDAHQFSKQIHAWHREATGSTTRPGLFGSSSYSGSTSKELDPALLLKVLPFGLPRSDRSLDLPRALVDKVSWIVVLPTEDCIAQVVSEMIDYGIAQAKLSFFERILIAPFMPTAKSRARAEMHEKMRLRIVEAFLGSQSAAVRERILSRLREENER